MPEQAIRAIDDRLKVSRGRFLKICGQVFGAAVLGSPLALRSWPTVAGTPGAAVAVAPPQGRFRVEDACASLFRPHLNAAFTVRSTGGARVRMVLARITEQPVRWGVEQFSLIFHAPAGGALPHGTYAFHHPAFGDFDLFIVPIGASNPGRTVHQACFSRHLSPARSPGGVRRRVSGPGMESPARPEDSHV